MKTENQILFSFTSLSQIELNSVISKGDKQDTKKKMEGSFRGRVYSLKTETKGIRVPSQKIYVKEIDVILHKEVSSKLVSVKYCDIHKKRFIEDGLSE